MAGATATQNAWNGKEPKPAKPAKPWERHVIERVSYATETIECTCGVIVTAEPDPYVHDAHEPLCDAWSDHRTAVGAKKSGNQSVRPLTAHW